MVVGRGVVVVVEGIEVVVGHVGQGWQVGTGGQEGAGGHVVGAAVVVVAGSQWPQESAHFDEHLLDWHFCWVPHFLSQNLSGLLSRQGASWSSSKGMAIIASEEGGREQDGQGAQGGTVGQEGEGGHVVAGWQSPHVLAHLLIHLGPNSI